MKINLINKKDNKLSKELLDIDLHKIQPNPSQPRKAFAVKQLTDLCESIKEVGIIQPLIVRSTNGGYELVAGERRFRAAKMAGLTTVPCVVQVIEDDKSALIALIENIQRQELNYFEEAEGLKELLTTWHMTQSEAAKKLSMNQSTLANKLRILQYSDRQRDFMLRNKLCERQARELLQIKDDEIRDKLLNKIVEKSLNVKQTEDLIREALNKKESPKNKKNFLYIIKDIRIFDNTIKHAIEVMQASGISAEAVINQNDEQLEYIIRINQKKSKIV